MHIDLVKNAHIIQISCASSYSQKIKLGECNLEICESNFFSVVKILFQDDIFLSHKITHYISE